MFWKKEYLPSVLKEASPEIVGCKLTDEELQQFLIENGIRFTIVDNSTRWCAFAHYYAFQYKFNMVKATSFAYMVSLFIGGMGISAGTEMYFKEEKIELFLMDRLNDIKSKKESEEDQIVEMFRNIFWLYKRHISEYEYATERLSFKMTPSEMEKFQSIEGKTNKDKFKYLLSLYEDEGKKQ